MKRNIRFLIGELTTMNAFLETLETLEKLDPLVQDWRNNICELTYDIEDCIDLFMHKLNRGDVKALCLKDRRYGQTLVVTPQDRQTS